MGDERSGITNKHDTTKFVPGPVVDQTHVDERPSQVMATGESPYLSF